AIDRRRTNAAAPVLARTDFSELAVVAKHRDIGPAHSEPDCRLRWREQLHAGDWLRMFHGGLGGRTESRSRQCLGSPGYRPAARRPQWTSGVSYAQAVAQRRRRVPPPFG